MGSSCAKGGNENIQPSLKRTRKKDKSKAGTIKSSQEPTLEEQKSIDDFV